MPRKNTVTISAGGKEISAKNLKKLLANDATPFEIVSATIKDDFCHYEYLITDGVGKGDTHKVKGSGIIMDDMREAFIAFHKHLACIDDIFKHSNIEIDDIEKFNGHAHTGLYYVTGFKIKGAKENESVILVGNKYISASGGRIEIETPRIPLDSTSSYKWHNELKAAVDLAREEVRLYKGGKYTEVEVDEEESLPTIAFDKDVNEDEDGDFSQSKVK